MRKRDDQSITFEKKLKQLSAQDQWYLRGYLDRALYSLTHTPAGGHGSKSGSQPGVRSRGRTANRWV